MRDRRSIRLEGYDYTQTGAYFITLCTQDRSCLFDDVMDGVQARVALLNPAMRSSFLIALCTNDLRWDCAALMANARCTIGQLNVCRQ
ncbi:MAG: hypothetical protein AB1714_08510 [Acidobacteriota bacterium]